ncbi:helicase C-terminal domain-containing protein [Lipomyces oligophaga]|uniref:helicase C-terminal domain-containing protein n=1 Tax=Lipomyces oligophaga TaxID=45792 RepID=UPI0034CD9E64
MTIQPSQPDSKRDFRFPYAAYDIQNDFMNAVWDTIEEGKIGIFESPTGTGKSLSLICGAMAWLRDHQSTKLDLDEISIDPSEPAFVREYELSLARESRVRKYKDLESRLSKHRLREQKERRQAALASKVGTRVYSRRNFSEDPRKRPKIDEVDSEDVAQFLLDDYNSDEEKPCKSSKNDDTGEIYSAQVRKLLDQMRAPSDISTEVEDDFTNETKIFYASRTHSQLSQFVDQLRLPKLSPSKLFSADGTVRHVGLSSRKQLCINPTISRFKDQTTINDKCIDLQEKSKGNRCPYKMNPDELADRVKLSEFRDRVLAEVADIEDIADIGRAIDVCPYYAVREVVDFSEVVTLPYPLLLQQDIRQTLNISLKGHIVIIDEAHNLIETISSLYSHSISLTEIQRSKDGLSFYLNKFFNKLNGNNIVYIKQILKLLIALESFLLSYKGSTGDEVQMNEILEQGSADTINIYKIKQYMQRSKLARKVETYIAHIIKVEEQEISKAESNSKSSKITLKESKSEHARDHSPILGNPVLSNVMQFLESLTNLSVEGAVFFEKSSTDVRLKYLLLDVSQHFKSIVDDARCVILAGGTMEPIEDFRRYLFSYVPEDRIQILSCGHVIPRTNLGAWTVGSGPTGKKLVLTYSNQRSREMIEELGRSVAALSRVIPDGLVLFFPSYEYMKYVIPAWKVAEAGRSIWDQIEQRKHIFIEPREATAVDGTLRDYAQALNEASGGLCESELRSGYRRGAMLLAVVGGKMSEGINFADKLARGIVMIGLPFPNMRSVDMVAKREYIEKSTSAAVRAREISGLNELEVARQQSRITSVCAREAEDASRLYYENVCMKAVNQSIGRGIRHANDYAVIIFMDARFGQPNIIEKLPKWIRERMDRTTGSNDGISTVLRNVGAFFKSKITFGLVIN